MTAALKLEIEYLDHYNPEWERLFYAKPGDSGFDLRAAIPEPITFATIQESSLYFAECDIGIGEPREYTATTREQLVELIKNEDALPIDVDNYPTMEQLRHVFMNTVDEVDEAKVVGEFSDVVVQNYNALAAMEKLARLEEIIPHYRHNIPTGIKVALPPGYEMQIRPRSGLAYKNGISVINSPGTIDNGYRGEITIIMINLGNEPITINPGDRIAQGVVCPIPQVELVQVDKVGETERNDGAFGSTGK